MAHKTCVYLSSREDFQLIRSILIIEGKSFSQWVNEKVQEEIEKRKQKS